MSRMGFVRSLATGEEVVVILHPHWKTLVRPILLTFVVVAVLLIGEVLIPASGAADGERLALAVPGHCAAYVVADDSAAQVAYDRL